LNENETTVNNVLLINIEKEKIYKTRKVTQSVS